MPSIIHWITGPAVGAGIAFIAGTATLGFAWYRAAVGQEEAAASKLSSVAAADRVRQVKSLLGKAGGSTGSIFNSDMNDADLTKAAEAWVNKTYKLIVAAYGDGEGALFMDNSGYTFFSNGSEKSKVRNWVDGRQRRLTELIPRTDHLPVRDDFDPKQFDF